MPDRYKNPPQGWFLAPFGGLDRSNFDPDPNFGHKYFDRKQGKWLIQDKPLRPAWKDPQVKVEWMLQWFKYLYDNSNFQFAGAYLSGEDPTEPPLGTGGSRNQSRRWTQNWTAILQQGWGIWAIYPAYANVGKDSAQDDVKLPPDWGTTKVERGKSAGTHIKFLASKLPGDNAGMVVYIDNENGKTEVMLPYYRAMFQEMQTDRVDGRPPVRAGIYIREGSRWPPRTGPFVEYANPVLDQFPDVFLWLIETGPKDVTPPTEPNQPYRTPIQRDAAAKFQRFEIESYPIVPQKLRFLPVGRQSTLIGETEGYTKSDVMGLGKGDTKALTISGWDFNVSFVRDPRYPQADPRFVCNGQDRIVYSKFGRSGVSVTELGQPAFSVQEIESEAPLVILDQELYSIDRNGNVVSGSKKTVPQQQLAQSRVWTRWEIAVANSNLRRLRAFSVARIPQSEVLLFWISTEHKVHVHRRQDSKPTAQKQANKWTSSGIWEVGELHPFTNISSILFKGMVWLFYMQKIGDDLTEASLSVTPWHENGSTQLGPGLKGTAIATVCTPEYLFVFTVNKARHLQFAHAHLDPKKKTLVWSWLKNALIDSFKSGPREPKLHPHTRIVACVVDAMHIRATAFSSDGVPCVYDIVFIAGASRWERSTCTQYPIIDGKKHKPPERLPIGFVASKAWTFNPYGDVALVQNGRSTELYCAGARPGDVGILLRRLEQNEPWLRQDA